MTPTAAAALKIAQSQIGVTEKPKGSNRGPEVEIYLKSVGLGGGYSWCMAFVFYCFSKTGMPHTLKKTGGVLAQWNAKPELRKVTPEPGDIFIMDFGKGLGHTGIVEKVLPGGKIQTIEGNTNDGGSREGDGVYRRTRNINACKGFLRV